MDSGWEDDVVARGGVGAAMVRSLGEVGADGRLEEQAVGVRPLPLTISHPPRPSLQLAIP